MRLLFAVNIPYPEGRANTRRIRTVARAMVQHGHQVTILLPFSRAPAPRIETVDGVRVMRCLVPIVDAAFQNAMGRVRLWVQVRSRLIWIVRLIRLSRSHDYDWLYLYQPGVDSLAAAIIAMSCGRRIVSEYVDILTPAEYRSLAMRAIYTLQVCADRIVPRMSDVVFTISSTLMRQYDRRGVRVPITVMPTLVDTTIFGASDGKAFRARRNLDDRLIVVFTGSFVRTEGLQVLAEATSKVLRDYPSVYLAIAGGSLVPDSDDCVALIARYDLQQHATYLGMLPQAEIVELQAAADVLVMPKLNSPNNHAGLATKLAEYLASGRAVVASRVGDVELYLRDGRDALLVTPGDIEGLETALRALFADEVLRRQLGANGRIAAARHFDAARNVERLLAKLATFSLK